LKHAHDLVVERDRARDLVHALHALADVHAQPGLT
jgi:hypothetical protein